MRRPEIVNHTNADRIGEELKENLRHGGGGGNNGDMEPRIARLEAHVEHIQSDVTDLKENAKSVNEKITDILVRLTRIENTMATSMATKGFVVTSQITLLIAIAALIGFTDQIQAFFGNKP